MTPSEKLLATINRRRARRQHKAWLDWTLKLAAGAAVSQALRIVAERLT